ncbi:hypothetical protein ABZ318_29525 [Streptomyces sp. NPDC006197]|uniref:hypothetical protein n=1 Tax=Streptomyces sp. NPDC006197 TaxID=3156685 RepID=UPI0033AD4E2A
MTTLRVAAGLFLAALATGCAAQENTTITPQPSEVPPPSKAVTSLRLPFDSYEMTENELHETANVRDFLTRQCMNERGHDWPLVQRPTGMPQAAHRRRYGVIEDAIARRYGYRVPEELFDPYGVQSAQRLRGERLTPAQEEAAYGTRETGCERTAFNKLVPRTRPDFNTFNDLKGSIFTEFQRTPEARTYTTAWSNCMKGKGHTYPDPFAPINDPRWRTELSLATPTPEEVRTARHDVACKEATGLVAGWRQAESNLQNRAITTRPDYFHELDRSRKEQLARARAIPVKP